MSKNKIIHKNPRNKKPTAHIGGVMIKREVTIYDGQKMDNQGLTLRDYE